MASTVIKYYPSNDRCFDNLNRIFDHVSLERLEGIILSKRQTLTLEEFLTEQVSAYYQQHQEDKPMIISDGYSVSIPSMRGEIAGDFYDELKYRLSPSQFSTLAEGQVVTYSYGVCLYNGKSFNYQSSHIRGRFTSCNIDDDCTDFNDFLYPLGENKSLNNMPLSRKEDFDIVNDAHVKLKRVYQQSCRSREQYPRFERHQRPEVSVNAVSKKSRCESKRRK